MQTQGPSRRRLHHSILRFGVCFGGLRSERSPLSCEVSGGTRRLPPKRDSPNSTAGAQVWSQRGRLTVSLSKAPGGAGRSIADDVLSKHQRQQHISRRHIYDGIATILGCVSGLGSRRFRLACVVFRLSQRLPPKKKGAPAIHGI